MITLRSAAEIERLAKVNALVARVLSELMATVEPSASTSRVRPVA